jgi:MFS family permease
MIDPAPDRAPASTQRSAATSQVWRNANFDRYWFGEALSAFGDQVSALALPLVAVVVLDGSPGEVGLLTAAIWTPSLLSLFVGTWVDKYRRQKRLMVVSNVLQAAAVTAVPLAYAADRLTMLVLYASAVALGASGVLYDTSYPSFFVRVVRREQYVAANSLLSTTVSVAALAGPAIAGVLIEALSAPDALLVDAATFLVSAIAISTVRIRSTPLTEPSTATPGGSGTDEPYSRRLLGGVTYLRRHHYLRASLLASATMNVAAFVVQAVLILYAVRYLDMTAGQIGLALSIGATGALLGALTAAPIAARLGAGRTIALGVGLHVVPFAALIIAEAIPGAGVAALAAVELVSAWAIMLFDINNNALRTVVTDDEMRGRVSGAYATVNYGIRPIGALIGGSLGATIGIPFTLAIAAVIGTAASAWIISSPIFGVRRITDLG